MRTRQEAIQYCLSLGGCYEDYPFRDPNWTVIRHNASCKVFAWTFEREGNIWINVKCDPEWRDFFRKAFDSVIPAYRLNKKYWNSIIFRRHCARGRHKADDPGELWVDGEIEEKGKAEDG